MTEESAEIDAARALLGTRLKVEVHDGRVFCGDFYCLDNLGNLLLLDTYELERNSLDQDGDLDIEELLKSLCIQERFVGIALLPQEMRKATYTLSKST